MASLNENRAHKAIIFTIIFAFCPSGAFAQEIAEAVNVCQIENFPKDENGRLLNHFTYPEANRSDLILHKTGSRRNCQYIARDMQKDLLDLLDAGQSATNGGLYALSCFRSTESQERIFCGKAFELGISLQERALQSAPSGHSEHSTGLVLDFGDSKHRKANLEQEFALTPSGKWLAANAPKYGFELSFPKSNKQGIAYEPWHWRWIGDGKTKSSLKARATFAQARKIFPPARAVKYSRQNYASLPNRSQQTLNQTITNYVPRIEAKPIGLNPLFIDDDDFIRLKDNPVWRGLEIKREVFSDEKANWAIWRINNLSRPNGPLWLSPHDNENAAFPALIFALKRYGGRAVFIDTGPRDTKQNARMNSDIFAGRPIDPNRYFAPNSIYTKKILKDLGHRSIIAVHTNSKGFNGNESDCNKDAPNANGRGVISVLFCDETMHPYKSISGNYPFDDDDSIAIIPFRYTQTPKAAYCANALQKRDFNIGFERVTKIGDGSLSNFALYKNIKYINLETLDRGSEPDGIKDAATRVGAMIDYVMKFCPVK